MRQTSVFLTALLCAALLPVQAQELPQINEPVFRFGVKHLGKNPHWLPADTGFDRRHTERGFCWEIVNLPADVVEVPVRQRIVAPEQTSFTSSVSGAVNSNSREHVSELLFRVADGRIGTCSRFEASDPQGEYTVQVETANRRYPPQKVILE